MKENVISKTTTTVHNADLVTLVTKALEDFKAHEIVSIELTGKSSIADHMLIASGTSSRQVTAMAENVISRLKQNGVKSINVEGINFGDWVLIDGGDIIIHLFRPEVRAFYGLEKMWGVEFETN
ncbi:MAG: ribosome silencing factor [Rhodospirillaceae bacterium]|nr:ribosome silencing factor [Rhodospirillaceae bacterium]